MKEINLVFKGYHLEKSFGSLPEESGIYCIYRCIYTKETSKVSIKELIYIGESENISTRLSNHDKLEDWKDECLTDECICLSYALVPEANRERAEAALIYKHDPVCNEMNTESFTDPDTIISTSGRNTLIEEKFIVRKTND